VKRLSVTFARTVDADGRLVPDPGERRGSVSNVQTRRDGTVLELCRFEAPDARDVAEDLADDPGVLDHAVVDERTVYVHLRPGERARALLDLLEAHHLLLEAPVRFDEARVTVRLVGRADRISAAAAAVPADVRADMRVEHLGEYTGAGDDHRERLTERQREVLAAAVDAGYYDTPRAATVADVAADLDRSVSTTSEHLRKIEARVLPALSGGGT